MGKGKGKSIVTKRKVKRKVVIDGVEVTPIPKNAALYLLRPTYEKVPVSWGGQPPPTWVVMHYPYPFAVVPGSFEVRPPSFAYPHSYLHHVFTLKYAKLLVIHKPLLYAKAHGITPAMAARGRCERQYGWAGITPDSSEMRELNREVLAYNITGQETKKWRLLDRTAVKWTKGRYKKE